VQRAQASAARGGLASVRITEGNVAEVPPEPALKVAALKIYPVLEEKQTIAGVEITVYSPKMLPAKNRHKVVMEFQMAVEAISIASLGQLKVIHFDTAGPGIIHRPAAAVGGTQLWGAQRSSEKARRPAGHAPRWRGCQRVPASFSDRRHPRHVLERNGASAPQAT